ncbi:hypothetical protein [Adhaeretor mobilis]|uniref:Uncharacterized protein n=1 Tax=Adhaeretor mobilis TaxID=1930276 RepID=A0A517MXY0_9BACT|nr:hypothetical protein [Adhaeretor mobilis]QDS99726.1 hypothetical protein HG15A2_30550 [Adhaeretor mobilis]
MSSEQQATDDAAVTAQQDLLEDSLELAFAEYDAALEQGVVQPVLLLIDCEDEIGRPIVSGWLGGSVVEDAIAEQQASREAAGEDSTTVFATAVSHEEARQRIPELFPYLSAVFELEDSENGFLAISVTAGGACALTVPFEARPSDG